MNTTTTSDLNRAADELAQAVRSLSTETLDAVATELASARSIACFAQGREGLILEGLAMRLFHAGADAHVIGEISCPAAGVGDLVVMSCGRGDAPLVEALARVVKNSGARLLYLTGQPSRSPAHLADRVVVIDPAADAESTSIFPAGSGYEIALFVLADLITNRVIKLRNRAERQVRSRPTKLA